VQQHRILVGHDRAFFGEPERCVIDVANYVIDRFFASWQQHQVCGRADHRAGERHGEKLHVRFFSNFSGENVANALDAEKEGLGMPQDVANLHESRRRQEMHKEFCAADHDKPYK